MMVSRSLLLKRYGTTSFGLTVSEEILGGREFERDNVKYVVRVGLTKVQEWDDVGTVWDDITGTDLTADNTYNVSFATPLLSGKRILVITNYKDNPRKYTGSGNTADLGGSPPKARFALEYGAYLLLAYINDGTVRPTRVQWSETGDCETWTGGSSGSKELIEDGESITGLANFGNYVAVHKENSIYLGYLVTSSTVFRFDRRSTGAGTVCHNTIQNLPTGEQIFLAKDGLRLFNGISAPLIESEITDDLRENINPAFVYRSWSIVVPELDEYWVGVPIGSAQYGSTIYKYNYNAKVAYRDTRGNVRSAFRYTDVSQPTWNDQTLTWDQASTLVWDSGQLNSLFSHVLLNHAEGITTVVDSSLNNDNGSAVDAFWESKDYESEEKGRLCRWIGMQLWAKGNTVTIEYSIDEGETWSSTLDQDGNATTTLMAAFPSDYAPIMVYFDVVSSRIRFRFRNLTASQTFFLKQFIINYTDREVRGA